MCSAKDWKQVPRSNPAFVFSQALTAVHTTISLSPYTLTDSVATPQNTSQRSSLLGLAIRCSKRTCTGGMSSHAETRRLVHGRGRISVLQALKRSRPAPEVRLYSRRALPLGPQYRHERLPSAEQLGPLILHMNLTHHSHRGALTLVGRLVGGQSPFHSRDRVSGTLLPYLPQPRAGVTSTMARSMAPCCLDVAATERRPGLARSARTSLHV